MTEQWLLISNCQTYGFAHSLQMLAEDVRVEPLDVGRYSVRTAEVNASLGGYDRVLVGPSAEGQPGADFAQARRVSRIPEPTFSAYHPDMGYVVSGDTMINGPTGAYHSMIALAAHRRGLTAEAALALYDRRTYAASGFLDRWGPARDQLVRHCGEYGVDAEAAVRRWGRERAFMLSGNHARIHVLYDLARLYLEKEGYTPRVSDILPPDTLASAEVFPVYREIGEALGVPGSYLFKFGHEFIQIDLRRFVEASFAIYEERRADDLAPHEACRTTFAAVEEALAKSATR